MERLFPDTYIEEFDGTLRIEGNFKENWLQLHFFFNKKESYPLLVFLELAPLGSLKNRSGDNKSHIDIVQCNIRDINNPRMSSTKVHRPKYVLENYKIIIFDVISHVSCKFD